MRCVKLPEGQPANRRDIIETASLFLGDRYVWGGRSSQQRRAGWLQGGAVVVLDSRPCVDGEPESVGEATMTS